LIGGSTARGGDAGWGERGGLFRGSVGREAFDHFDRVFLEIAGGEVGLEMIDDEAMDNPLFPALRSSPRAV